jgi:hypothetical protein
MSAMQPHENMLQYLVRQFREAPTAALSAILILALFFMWQQSREDAEMHRNYMREQNEAQVQCIREQTAAFVQVAEKLQHIEGRLEQLEKHKGI